MKKTSIYNSKPKYAIWLLISLIFIGIGVMLLTSKRTFDVAIALGNIFIFGFFFSFFFRGFMSRKEKLIIDEQGIIDQVNPVSVGFIPWKEITEVSTVRKVILQRLLVVKVKHPNKILDDAKGSRREKSLRMFNQKYGTPVVIPIHMLNMKTDKIKQLIQERLH